MNPFVSCTSCATVTRCLCASAAVVVTGELTTHTALLTAVFIMVAWKIEGTELLGGDKTHLQYKRSAQPAVSVIAQDNHRRNDR